ncbi:DUF397 domain-containing protein [Streptomyces sp. H10-C2]|uniref:DUF397 domain-containing protein n=1 Tax=unclassified Streptomyces TaxID=2593676 RepID=UPI0024B9F1A6|nr:MULTISPECIES: DUF397 domain-containing protein [unclassified Streptomyces]MDJ0344100.1 DUF397 domain-containing protein [Streptomyces sp. PH10-H1]MDJ0368639.1 DUF397 domain-containing protein [Streptomyces sp. H10-C2]
MSVLPRYVSSSSTLCATRWRRSSHSTAANNCVETAQLSSGLLAVRDSKNPQGPALLFASAAWSAFVRALRADEFAGLH